MRGQDIAIDNHRYSNGVFDGAHGFPIGCSGIALFAGTAMHSDHLYAHFFCLASQRRGIQVVCIPAQAHFDGHGNIYGLHGFGHDFCGQRFILHQGGAGHFLDDFLNRASKVNINNGCAALYIHARCFGHSLRVAACQLYCHGKFFGVIFIHFERAAGLLNHLAAGDHFGKDKSGAIRLNQTPER